MPETCGVCGCSEELPCLNPLLPGGACAWFAPGVCTVCAALIHGLAALDLATDEHIQEVLSRPSAAEQLAEPTIVLATEFQAETMIRKMRAAGA